MNDAVESCIRDSILAEFLKAHRAEVIEVVLTEYDEKGYIAYEKKLSHEEGHREGRLEGLREGHKKGREEGNLNKLIEQVCKKLAKGKNIEQIAEELEEKPETIAGICEAASHFSPDYDCDKIAVWMKEKDKKE